MSSIDNLLESEADFRNTIQIALYGGQMSPYEAIELCAKTGNAKELYFRRDEVPDALVSGLILNDEVSTGDLECIFSSLPVGPIIALEIISQLVQEPLKKPIQFDVTPVDLPIHLAALPDRAREKSLHVMRWIASQLENEQIESCSLSYPASHSISDGVLMSRGILFNQLLQCLQAKDAFVLFAGLCTAINRPYKADRNIFYVINSILKSPELIDITENNHDLLKEIKKSQLESFSREGRTLQYRDLAIADNLTAFTSGKTDSRRMTNFARSWIEEMVPLVSGLIKKPKPEYSAVFNVDSRGKKAGFFALEKAVLVSESFSAFKTEPEDRSNEMREFNARIVAMFMINGRKALHVEKPERKEAFMEWFGPRTDWALAFKLGGKAMESAFADHMVQKEYFMDDMPIRSIRRALESNLGL